MRAPAFTSEFEDIIAAWPAPVQLKHQEGDVFLTFSLHPNFIEAKWSGHITAGDVITASKAYLALMQRHHGPNKLLNDKTGVTGDWAEANDWLEFEWLPQVVKAGLQAMAHVYSSNMFSRLSARDLYLRVTPRLHMHNFNDRAHALDWLLSLEGNSTDQVTE